MITIDRIKQTTADHFDLPVEAIDLPTRKREIVIARQVAHYYSKQLTKNSLTHIGLTIGGKTHATVLHSCRTVDDLIATDKDFRQIVTDIWHHLCSMPPLLTYEEVGEFAANIPQL